MATTEIAATPEINDAVMAQLIDMAGYVVGDYTRGFNFRAEATRENFFEDPTNPKWTAPEHYTVGRTFEDDDYAFLVLMNPANRALLAERFNEANAFRAARHGENGWDALPIDVATAISVANTVLDALALEQEADRVLSVSFEEDGFMEEFVGFIFDFFETGEVPERD
jgi:hypothetical protein